AAEGRRARARGEPDARRATHGRRPRRGEAPGTDRNLAGRVAAGGGAVRGNRTDDGGGRMKLIDAARCPYCARVRIALAAKGLEWGVVGAALAARPEWLIALTPPRGRVPVLDDGFTLPESEVIMAYLEEKYPEPPLLPDDLAERARARLLVQRFDENLGDDY